ncbi:MAG TPA: hypothetical protein VF668_01350 [Pyrinomonadaceae bacterium]|jgi:hypothetical protein
MDNRPSDEELETKAFKALRYRAKLAAAAFLDVTYSTRGGAEKQKTLRQREIDDGVFNGLCLALSDLTPTLTCSGWRTRLVEEVKADRALRAAVDALGATRALDHRLLEERIEDLRDALLAHGAKGDAAFVMEVRAKLESYERMAAAAVA